MTRSDQIRFVRGGVAAASLVNLAMLGFWTLLLDPDRSSSGWGYPTLEASLAPVAVCVLASGIGGMLMLSWNRLPRVMRAGIELLTIACAIFALNGLRLVSGMMLPQVDALLSRRWVVWLGLTITAVVLAIYFRRHVVRGFVVLLLVFSPLVAFNVGRSIVVALRTDYGALNPQVKHLPQRSARSGMRVILIVFDEMDYNFAFANRPRDLVLRSFDKVRGESFFATDAHSPGLATEVSIPSYLTGKEVSTIVRRGVASFDVRLSGETTVLDISREPTIFLDAFELGARSELVGFHVPYCRWALAAYVERCTWSPISEGGILDGPVGFPRAVIRQLFALAFVGNRLAHINRIKRLVSAGIRSASDPRIRLALLHLPSPHMPPVWNRDSGRFTVWDIRASSYFDNLALADRILGSILDVTSRAGVDDRTTFIITSDHPWRFGPIGGRPPGATIPFIVRMPDRIAVEWTAPLATVRVRNLIRALLSGAISTTPQLTEWATQGSRRGGS